MYVFVFLIVVLVAIGTWYWFIYRSSPSKNPKLPTSQPNQQKEDPFCTTGNDIGCKVQPWDSCKVSTQCPEDFMCLNSTCIPKPKDKQEMDAVSLHRGRLCFNEHPFVFTEGKFVFSPKHWRYENTLSMVEYRQTSTDDTIMVILTPTTIDTLYKDKIRSMSNDWNFVQIFELSGDLYAISKDGSLYYGGPIGNNRKYKWEKITFFRGRDLQGVYFLSWIRCQDGFILLCQGGPSLKYTIHRVSDTITAGDWSFVNIQHFTKYHNGMYITFPDDQHATLFDGRQNIDLGNIIDAEFLDNGDILLLYPKGTISKLSLSDMNLTPIQGKGSRFIKTSQNIWMIAKYHCIDI